MLFSAIAQRRITTVARRHSTIKVHVDWVRIVVWGGLIAVIALMVGARVAGWTPVVGRSMEPTLPRFGGFVLTNTSVSPVVGCMVKFNAPNDNGLCVKRVSRISPDGDWFWVTADNAGWTGEDSDHYGWVRKDRIVGTVVSIMTPATATNNFTRCGKWKNWASLRIQPGTFKICPDNEHVATIKDSAIAVYSLAQAPEGGYQCLFSDKYWESNIPSELGGESYRWECSKLHYRNDSTRPSVWQIYDADTGRKSTFDVFAEIPDIVEVNGKTSKFVKPGGKAYIRAGNMMFEPAKDSPRGTKMDMTIGGQVVNDLCYTVVLTKRTEMINKGAWPVKVMPMDG